MIRRQAQIRGWNWFRRRAQLLVVCSAALLLAGLAVGSVVGGNFGDGTNAGFRCPIGSSPSSGPISSAPISSAPLVTGRASSAPAVSGPSSNPITSGPPCCFGGSSCPVVSSAPGSQPTTTQTQTQTQTRPQTPTQTQVQGPPPPPPPPQNVFIGILRSQFGTLTVSHSGVITIPGTHFTCPTGDIRCIIIASGNGVFPHFKAAVQAARKKRPKKLSLGTTQTTVAGGSQGSAKLKLNKKAQKALAKSKKVKATFKITVRDAAGATIGTRTVTATIKTGKQHKRKHKHKH